MSKEEMFLRKIELAEIKENAWKWRGSTSSHEEHARRQEKGKKTAEKEREEEILKEAPDLVLQDLVGGAPG